ncbi:unnamed protein product [Spodoptera littoralis]|uniref:Cytosolic fatty-acid binding proteins domain-containing protein n=1 Tax=Spodoptera littoralis TaxID=7109 RepID=A0A9P0I6R0_SPOLI|nr:unnamed protein product [Spodoptera littoralis]CAH1640973.1 unnamed protein product [Spodoptera littoralis]
MSFLNKNYKFVSQENFEGFLKAVGVAEDRFEQLMKFAPDQKLTKDGDTYTYYNVTPEGPKEVKFKSGVEIDELLGSSKVPAHNASVTPLVLRVSMGGADRLPSGDPSACLPPIPLKMCKFELCSGFAQTTSFICTSLWLTVKSTYVVGGDTMTQTVKSVERGVAVFKREYNGDDLVVMPNTHRPRRAVFSPPPALARSMRWSDAGATHAGRRNAAYPLRLS